MPIETVAVVSAGDMGHVVGRVVREKGYRVITSLDGRSELTRERAERSGMEDVGDIASVVREADAVLSIMPPELALSLAEEVAGCLTGGKKARLFADCNAVSPSTTAKMQSVIERSAGAFVKIGIVGPPPGRAGATRFYAAGPAVKDLSFLDGDGIDYRNLGDECAKAAAVKMCYAALTKGTMTLHTAVLTTAELLDISDELRAELASSQTFHWDLMNKRMPFYAADAGRWAGEMDEISETFSDTGVTGNLHKGAADVFRMLDKTPLAEETRETADKSRTLDQAVSIYAETVRFGK